MSKFAETDDVFDSRYHTGSCNSRYTGSDGDGGNGIVVTRCNQIKNERTLFETGFNTDFGFDFFPVYRFGGTLCKTV